MPRHFALVAAVPLAVLLLAAPLAARKASPASQPSLGVSGTRGVAAPVPAPAIVAVIHADRLGRPVSRYEYGMFIENIGPLVYRTLWAQMLDDRKFYFPIRPAPPHAAPPAQGFFRFMRPRHWRPIGPAAAVTMDARHPFVGRHSPRVQLAGAAPRGFRQSGLALVAGRHYTGHIYLRGTPGAAVTVSLAWGAGPAARQSHTFAHLSRAYQRYPFAFTAGAASTHAVFSITGAGRGSFHVGVVSLMPADNLDGFRPHVIALLRQLHSGFWRFPGGNFISDFHWYDAIGPRDHRRPTFDYAWHAMQPNDVGLPEFMTLCRLIGARPYITVNAGFGGALSAAHEVEYMNGAVTTRLGALRARYGHPAPYGVKFWDIGNEPYGPWELGRTDLKYYVLKHNQFARAMRRVDPNIVLLASGAMPDEETIEGIAAGLHLKNDQVPFCGPADWTCGFLQHSWGYFNGITEHWYARAGVRFDLARAIRGLRYHHMEAGYVPARQTVLQWVRVPSDRVHLKAEEWHVYQRRFPAMARKHIFMSMDEYAYTGAPPNLKLDLAYAMTFNEMLRHTGFLRMAAFTMGVSTLNITPTGSSLNTTGLLFQLYGRFMGAGMLPLAVTGNSPQPPPGPPIADGLPRSSAGSPTYPLDIFAALTPHRRFLRLAVINATADTQPLHLRLAAARLAGPGTLWELTGKSLAAANPPGHPPGVTVRRRALPGDPATVSVPPISVDIYQFPVAPSPTR